MKALFRCHKILKKKLFQRILDCLNFEPYNSFYKEQIYTKEKILDKINEMKFEDAEEFHKKWNKKYLILINLN